MPKSQSRGIEKYPDEKTCRRVIDWLNGSADDPGRKRIRQLLRNIRVVKSNWVEYEDGDGGYLQYEGSKEDYRRAHSKIITLLKRYRFFPALFSFGGRLLTQWAPVSGPDGKFRRHWPPADGKYDDFQAIYELTFPRSLGIERIEECDCGKWFFMKFKHQRFCSARCRDRANKSSPKWREYRRNKAREYYWLHKTRNVS